MFSPEETAFLGRRTACVEWGLGSIREKTSKRKLSARTFGSARLANVRNAAKSSPRKSSHDAARPNSWPGDRGTLLLIDHGYLTESFKSV